MTMAGFAGPVDPGSGNPIGIVSLTSGGLETVDSTASGSSVTWSAGLLTGNLNVTGNFNIGTATVGLGLDAGTLDLADGTGTWTGTHPLYLDSNSTFGIPGAEFDP